MAFLNYDGVNLLHLTNLFNSCISEEQLNQEIRSTQNLSMLQPLLEIKLQLINISNHSPINYPIDFILNQFFTNSNELYTTLTIALKVQADTSEYLKLLMVIKENIFLTSESLHYIKLLEVTLKLCKFKREHDAFIKYTDCNKFDNDITALINTDNRTIFNFLTVNILPIYLNLNSESSKSLLVQISNHSLEMKHLDILCAIPQLFIDCNNILLKDDCFWYLLQNNLNDNNSKLQKQALFLLKKALQSCQKHESFSSLLGVVKWNGGDKNEVFLAWRNLLILYEVGREKQLHLIEPIYQLIPTIKVLHPSWLSSIFRILLLHPQQTVCTYTVLDLLKSNWYFNDAVFKDVIQCLIYVLNKTDFALNKDVWKYLSKFSENLDNEKFIVLLQESAKISWIPSLCYRFYYTLLNSKTKVFLPFQLCIEIFSNLRKLPHKFIRDECLCITIDYVQEAHLQHANFKDYINLNKLFFKDNFQLWQRNNLEKFIPDLQTIIQSWRGNETTDLKNVDAVIKVIEDMNNEKLDNLLYELFTDNFLCGFIRDRLCVFFALKNKDISLYVNNRLLNIRESDDTYLKQLAPLLTFSDYKEILKTCFDILLNDNINEIQTEVCFNFVNSLLEEINNTTILDKILLKWEKKFLENKSCNPHICLCFIKIFSKRQLDSLVKNDFLKTIHIFENILETQDYIVLPEIFFQLRLIINSCDQLESLFPFIDLCVRKLVELRGNKYFKIAVENFINSVLLNDIILYSCNEGAFEKCRDLLRLLFEWTYSSEDVGLSLSRNMCKLSEVKPEVAFEFVSIGLKLLIFGDILKKDQRAEYEICQIISQAKKGLKNPNLTKLAIRGEIIKYIQNILNNAHDEKRAIKANTISALLLKKYSIYANKRCFSDSQVHLIKLRILQALLLIHDYMQEKEDLIDMLLNSLCTESHQLSNKFIIVWLLIRLLYTKDNCLDLITSKIESTSKVHSSTIFAFIPVLYHIAILKNDNSFWFKVFKQLLPWTMGAHFNLRLYAQVGIKKLYEVLHQMGNEKVCAQFKEVVESITDVLDKTEREVEVVDKYMFDYFKPIEDFNLGTIYYIIPHITNVTNDEYENNLNILNCVVNKSPNLERLRRVQVKPSKEIYESFSTSIIQKKIIPQESVNRKIGELVVVASLIDKIPNLGGLSRTSEVFGVKELVISSLNIMKNSEFQNLSMSSENWINISEVKIDQLQSFLLSMKENKYSIIGAEQTSESVKLNNFKFPSKSLLLLGNEKEGIPPNLLSLVDTCVEIPQLGVVRSLNVHVAAATFIWEYSKVHML